jgi:4'-phosphopantetheinyl transferase
METKIILPKIKQIDVWAIEIPKFYEHESYYYSLLSESEKKRSNAFVTAQLKSRYTISQSILRLLLSEYTQQKPEDILYSHGSHRKPYLATNPLELQFNLSHSNDMALIGVSMIDEVGVDIEKLNPKTIEKGLEKSVMCKEELEAYNHIPYSSRTEAFFSNWTHKESLLKLIGIGLYKEMNELNVPLKPLPLTTPVLYENSQKYLQSFYVTSDYLGAVASPKEEFEVLLRNYDKKS